MERLQSLNTAKSATTTSSYLHFSVSSQTPQKGKEKKNERRNGMNREQTPVLAFEMNSVSKGSYSVDHLQARIFPNGKRITVRAKKYYMNFFRLFPFLLVSLPFYMT